MPLTFWATHVLQWRKQREAKERSGANYLYMARPEDTPSILDILPPNFVIRVIIMGVVVTTLFVLSYLPWYLKDRKAAVTNADSVGEH